LAILPFEQVAGLFFTFLVLSKTTLSSKKTKTRNNIANLISAFLLSFCTFFKAF
jgi:hypothetical protein